MVKHLESLILGYMQHMKPMQGNSGSVLSLGFNIPVMLTWDPRQLAPLEKCQNISYTRIKHKNKFITNFKKETTLYFR